MHYLRCRMVPTAESPAVAALLLTKAMNTTERVAALWKLYEQLDALITADEFEIYDPLTGLGDLISDLELDE
jgi:hypothetical protein